MRQTYPQCVEFRQEFRAAQVLDEIGEGQAAVQLIEEQYENAVLRQHGQDVVEQAGHAADGCAHSC